MNGGKGTHNSHNKYQHDGKLHECIVSITTIGCVVRCPSQENMPGLENLGRVR